MFREETFLYGACRAQSMKVRPADAVSWLRVALGIVLYVLAFASQRFAFVFLFLFAGVLDIVDGMLARTFGATRGGVVLDSWADRFIAISAIVWLWLLAPSVLLRIWPFVIALLVAEIFARVWQYRKHGTLAGYHLLSGKCMATLFYLFVASAVIGGRVTWLWYAFLAFAVLNYLEEFILTARLKRFIPDIKSAFFK